MEFLSNIPPSNSFVLVFEVSAKTEKKSLGNQRIILSILAEPNLDSPANIDAKLEYDNFEEYKNNAEANSEKQRIIIENLHMELSANYYNNNNNNNNNYGGVRYIKKRIEKILAKLNVDIIMGTLKLKNNNIITIDNKYIDTNL